MKRKKLFYGWIVVIGCVLMMLTMWGLGNHPLSLYVVPVTAAYGFSRTSFSMIFSIINLCTAAGSMAYGFLSGKMGLKRLMLLGSALCVVSYVLYSSARVIAVFYLAAAIFGLALSMTTNNPLSQIVNNWFTTRRGAVLGLVYASSGLGGTICDILVGRILNRAGFRSSLWITTAMIAVLLTVAMLILRESPDSMGLRPYGSDAPKKETGEAPEKKTGLTLRQAVKTPNFWLLIALEVLWGLSIIPIAANIPAHLTDRGLDPLFISGTVMAVMFAVSAASKFGMGIICDKFGHTCMLLVIGVTSTAAAALLPAVSGRGSAVIMAVLMGIGYACMTIPAPLLVSHIFGNRDYAAILGPVTATLTFAGAVGMPVSNMIFDHSGSYAPAFIVQAACFALAAVCGILAVRIKIKKPE